MTEVMIVLAVSSALFLTVSLAFAGRQGRVEFTQAVRNYEANLQNIISDVSEGNYQSGFRCTSPATGAPTINSSPTAAGSNSGCIFLGKLIVSGTESSNILTIVGRRTASGTQNDVSNLAQSSPVAVHGISGVNVTSVTNHSFGLQVRKVVRLSDSTTEVASFGFFHQLGGSTSGVKGGTRSILLYGIPGTSAATTADNAATQIGSLTSLPEGVLICLLGANGQRAEITLGSENSQSSIASVLDTANSGACSE